MARDRDPKDIIDHKAQKEISPLRKGRSKFKKYDLSWIKCYTCKYPGCYAKGYP